MLLLKRQTNADELRAMYPYSVVSELLIMNEKDLFSTSGNKTSKSTIQHWLASDGLEALIHLGSNCVTLVAKNTRLCALEAVYEHILLRRF